MITEENETTDTKTAVPPMPIEAESTVSSKSRWEALIVILLILILAVGAYFRFTGLNWDENYHLHPDERFLTIVTSQLHTVSNPLAYLKTSESTLNPYNVGQTFYVYGNFPMTVTRYLAEWVTQFCQLFPGDGTPDSAL
jgi:flagellar basal body-associated protein FliL